MSIYDRIESALRRHLQPETYATALIDALEQAAVEPIVEAIGNIDCCCPCCDAHRDVLTRLAGGVVPSKGGE